MGMKEIILYFVSFIFGSLILAILIVGLARLISKDNSSIQDNDPTIHIEKGKSYENKKETSFKVFQVLSDGALMDEIADKEKELYFGKVVLIRGKDFYNDQVVTVKNPRIVGIYRYTTVENFDMSVPIIEGEME